MKVLATPTVLNSESAGEISIADPIPILRTDALTGLKSVASNSVQTCLTSPPFYLLRRYGTSAVWPDGWEGELGHEKKAHPNDFVRHLLYVFDEVWRVLRNDGCLWVNLADTYNNKQGKKGTTNAPNRWRATSGAGNRWLRSADSSPAATQALRSRNSPTNPRWACHTDSTLQ